MNENVFGGEARPEGLEIDGGEGVDQKNFPGDQELQQADAGAVMVHVVRLGIEGAFLHPLERGKERGQLAGLVDQLIRRQRDFVHWAARKRRSGGGRKREMR